MNGKVVDIGKASESRQKLVAEVHAMRAPDARAFVFRKDTWEVKLTATGQAHSLRGEPGTWSRLENWPDKPEWILAAVCCPRCKLPSVLTPKVHTVSQFGHVTPDFFCTQMPGGSTLNVLDTPHHCGFHRPIFLDHWNKKPLYAIATEQLRGDKWIPQIEYCHASTVAQAREHLAGSGEYKIVAIGRAIGYNVLDKEGLVLSV